MYKLYFCSLLLTAVAIGPAQAQVDSNIANGRIYDAFGLRIGVAGNDLGTASPAIQNPFDAPPVGTGIRPLLSPYYEAHLEPGLTAVASMMLVYRSFHALDLSDTRFESYGFNVGVRWEPACRNGRAASTHLFFLPGLGFDTFDDRVSVSLPLQAGALVPLGRATQLELSGIVTPELFLGVGPGMYYGITAGIRFINPL